MRCPDCASTSRATACPIEGPYRCTNKLVREASSGTCSHLLRRPADGCRQSDTPGRRLQCQRSVGVALVWPGEARGGGHRIRPVVASTTRGSVGTDQWRHPLPAVPWVRRMLSPAVSTRWAWRMSRSTAAFAMVRIAARLSPIVTNLYLSSPDSEDTLLCTHEPKAEMLMFTNGQKTPGVRLCLDFMHRFGVDGSGPRGLTADIPRACSLPRGPRTAVQEAPAASLRRAG